MIPMGKTHKTYIKKLTGGGEGGGSWGNHIDNATKVMLF